MESRASWTARIISRLDAWLYCQHREVNYSLTQLLTGHGLFRAHLCEMARVPESDCVFCDSQRDDACHTSFECEEWRAERSRLEETYGSVTTENIVGVMLLSQDAWTAVARFAESVLRREKRALDALY